MTREQFRQHVNDVTRYGVAPRLCLLGEVDYLSLYQSVLVSVGELVPDDTRGGILGELAKLNVCAFYYHGIICIKGRDEFGVHFA